jgi:hypothetical protein
MTNEGMTDMFTAHTVRRRIRGQDILLNLRTGYFYALDTVGTLMVDLLSREGDLNKVARQICQEYEVTYETVKDDLLELLQALTHAGLVDRSWMSDIHES